MKFLISILVVLFSFITSSIKAQNKKITVTVVNATSDVGKIGFSLYAKDNFMRIPIQGKEGKIKEGKSTIVFENVPEGEYAVICFHDKNNNDQMDFSANGMPLEDYGASNNALNPYGPPTFDSAKFIVSDKNVSLAIKF